MKQVEFLTIYGAYGGGDDRRSPDELIGWFSSKSTADIASDRKGWYGGPGLVKSNPAVRIDGKVYVLRSADAIDLDGTAAKATEELRKRAISKLTPVEQAALGLGKGGDE